MRSKRCSKGKSCGGTCINRSLTCRLDLGTSLFLSLRKTRDGVLNSGSSQPSQSVSRVPKDKVQELALEIRRKKKNNEDYSQDWNKLLGIIDSLEGGAKRDAKIKANAALGKRLRITVNHTAESRTESQRAGKKLLDKYQPMKRAAELADRYEALFNSVAQKLNENLSPDQLEKVKEKLREINAKRGRIENRLVEIMGSFRARLLDTNLTDKQVKDLVSRVWTPNTSETTRSHMEEFIRLFNGRGFIDVEGVSGGKSVRSVSETTERAHANSLRGIVKTNGDKTTTFHELAHIVEGQRPWLAMYAVGWRSERAYEMPEVRQTIRNQYAAPVGYQNSPRGTSLPILRLKDIIPGHPYRDDEIAVVGDFMHPYMGKVYAPNPGRRQNNTEVWSMAMEKFASPEQMATLYRKHPELFEVIVGLAISP